jgi:hypothetical protein
LRNLLKLVLSVFDLVWMRRALAVRGDRHSENHAVSKIYVTHSGLRVNAMNSDVSWEKTYCARIEAEKQMRHDREGGR